MPGGAVADTGRRDADGMRRAASAGYGSAPRGLRHVWRYAACPLAGAGRPVRHPLAAGGIGIKGGAGRGVRRRKEVRDGWSESGLDF